MQLKVGDQVVMHTCPEAKTHDGKVWTVESGTKQIGGEDVVWLEGYRGCFAVEYLQKVNVPGYYGASTGICGVGVNAMKEPDGH